MVQLDDKKRVGIMHALLEQEALPLVAVFRVIHIQQKLISAGAALILQCDSLHHHDAGAAAEQVVVALQRTFGKSAAQISVDALHGLDQKAVFGQAFADMDRPLQRRHRNSHIAVSSFTVKIDMPLYQFYYNLFCRQGISRYPLKYWIIDSISAPWAGRGGKRSKK